MGGTLEEARLEGQLFEVYEQAARGNQLYKFYLVFLTFLGKRESCGLFYSTRWDHVVTKGEKKHILIC